VLCRRTTSKPGRVGGALEKPPVPPATFGCVADWIYRRIGGLADHDSGYRNITIAPKADHRGDPHLPVTIGLIAVSWERKAGQFLLHVEISADTTASIKLPDGTIQRVGSGSCECSCPDPPERASVTMARRS
jgi:alpha-L-rhamnosidase